MPSGFKSRFDPSIGAVKLEVDLNRKEPENQALFWSMKQVKNRTLLACGDASFDRI
jgi:hypothetical protein